MHDPRGAGDRPRTTPPIEAHGVIGNQETAAFVAPDATIDYLCFPRFDSPTVFARLLDRDRGGAFELHPLGPCARSQAWLRDTHVLVTRFAGPDGIAEITDLMPIDDRGPIRALVRRVDVREGRLRFHARCAPRFDYARRRHAARPVADGVELCPDGGATPPLRLVATVPLVLDGHDATAAFELTAGQSACFVLAPKPPAAPIAPRVAAWITTTAARWRVWAAQIAYRGRWSEPVRRSALVLHLLTAARHGAIVAAPTFGLPEDVGGERNWDYRYSWIRDSAFAVYALTRLGHGEAARAFMRWVLDVCLPRHRGGRFIAPDDPRWLSTLAAIDRELRRGPRVHRYSPRDDIDGLEGREGSFTACSFWFVECLARAGRLDEARRLFDDLLARQSPLGLLAEELGPGGHHLGNYPQALSHLALISAAHRLDVELDRHPAATPPPRAATAPADR